MERLEPGVRLNLRKLYQVSKVKLGYGPVTVLIYEKNPGRSHDRRKTYEYGESKRSDEVLPLEPITAKPRVHGREVRHNA